MRTKLRNSVNKNDIARPIIAVSVFVKGLKKFQRQSRLSMFRTFCYIIDKQFLFNGSELCILADSIRQIYYTSLDFNFVKATNSQIEFMSNKFHISRIQYI
jgi:hypothetical protein